MFNWFAYRANELVVLLIIDKLIYTKWSFIADCFILQPVELVILNISCNAHFFQPLIIFFTSITSIGGNIIGLLFEVVYVLIKVINQRVSINN